jgi:hypothetical protein
MLLDILDNLPRLCMSSNQLRMVLWLLKECVSDVPSYDALRKVQTNLRECCGSIPKAYKSSLGNVFYVNDVRESVARVRLCGKTHQLVWCAVDRILQTLRLPSTCICTPKRQMVQSQKFGNWALEGISSIWANAYVFTWALTVFCQWSCTAGWWPICYPTGLGCLWW